MHKKVSGFVLVVGTSALALFTSLPGLASNSIEIIQSVPVETALATSGVRSAQEVWVEMIAGAHSTIDIEQFYISDEKGQSLEPVLQAIELAAKRGVRVRLVADSKFYKTYPLSVDHIGQTINSEARLIDFSKSGGVQHAKFFIVDGKQSFVGSHNFDWRALSHIHEVGVRISDPKANSDLKLIFEKDWAVAQSVRPTLSLQNWSGLWGAALKPGSSLGTLEDSLLVVASPATENPEGIAESLSAILGLMSSAHKTIQIQSMEYSTSIFGQSGGEPWLVLDQAIRSAAKRGVSVQILVDASKVKKAKKELSALAGIKNIEVRAATIPQWSGGTLEFARLIHSKYMTVDDSVSWVGTENWSMSYFMNTRNVGVIIPYQEDTQVLGRIFNQLWQSQYVSKVK